ncbi:MAG: translocation/assembly module TamB domain-containing protein [Rhodospirillales bacterium]|nr:translocation/assembly module TamB domain-containing protein [Alphaproteobacteria bacterium]USO05529.1 MAG: translocation/assembly module TamB domain-containing protein [Rhodospirillales bacterium]
MKRAALKFLIWAAGTTLLLATLVILAGALGLSWLGGSESGRNWIAGQISALASSEDLTVEINGIQTLNSRHVAVSSIALKDQGGAFATLKNVEIDFVAEHLLAGNLHINRIGVKEASLSRLLPEGEEGKATNAFPDIPDLHIESLNIENINLAPEITGKSEMLALDGTLLLSPVLHKNHISLQLEDKNTANLMADITFAPEVDDLKLQASIKDNGQGLLARLSGLPLIDVSLEGAGSLENWEGQLQATTGEAFKTEGQVVLNLKAKQPVLTLAGKTQYEGYKADGDATLTFDHKTEKLDFVFSGDFEEEDYALRGLSLRGQAKPEKTFFGAGHGTVNLSCTGNTQNVVDLETVENIDLLTGAVFEAQGRIKGDQIDITASRIKTDRFNLTATGIVDLESNQTKLATKTDVADLSWLSSDFTGSSTIQAQISGSVEPLDLKAPVQITTQNFKTVWPDVNEALGITPSAKADLSYTDKLGIKNGVLKGAKLKALNFSGTIGDSQTRLNMAMNYFEHDIKMVLNIKGGDLVFDPITITGDLGKLNGNATYNLDQEKVQAALTLKPDNNNTFSAKLSGQSESLSYTGDWRGEGAYPFTFKYEGAIDNQQNTVVKLSKFSGDYGPNRLALKNPAILTFKEGGAEVDNLAFGLNDGMLGAFGKFSAKEFSVTLKANNLPANLNVFPFVFDGRFAGDISLFGPYASPVGKAQFDLKRIAIPGIDEAENRYVDGTLSASYKNHVITAQTDLSGPAELKFKAKVTLPLTISPLVIPFDKPVSGNVNASVDLKALSLLLGLDEHSITGRSTLDVSLSGTLNKPAITGKGNLRNGTYENLLLGTRFKDITGEVTASENRLSLKNLEGRDTNGGIFTGSGHIDFRNIRDPQYQFALETKTLQLVNTDRMGVTASGQLKTAGDMDKAEVKGQVMINQAEYYISQLVSTSSLSSFTIIEENGNGDEGANTQEKQNGPDVMLNIGIEANNNVYVRGPDLETEWSGKLNVTGTAKELEIKGGLSLVRGRFQLLDTPVQLSKGNVRFAGDDPANPDIDVSGTIKGRDMDAILKITGETKAPEIGLQSEPPLPEDEILAKTLFGKSVSQLSPVQALRIAQLMAYLSGRQEASFDPLNDIRRAIGIDTLSVGMDDEKGATLSIGKYVNDRVYIGVDQGTTPGSSAVRAEIEVTDDIEVETKTNSTNESSVGVNWKKDY